MELRQPDARRSDQVAQHDAIRAILRRREEDGPLEAGILQPLADGKPISGEVISMRRREDVPFLFDVTTEVTTPSAEQPATGPAQVATESYRRGWDAIWGRRQRSTALN